MATCTSAQNALCKKLGKDYHICYVDLERCIYRDFGNGFNLEISCTHTVSKRKKAKLYLWFGECFIVRKVYGVAQEDIGTVAEELHEYTKQLIKQGYDNRIALLDMLHPKLNNERN